MFATLWVPEYDRSGMRAMGGALEALCSEDHGSRGKGAFPQMLSLLAERTGVQRVDGGPPDVRVFVKSRSVVGIGGG